MMYKDLGHILPQLGWTETHLGRAAGISARATSQGGGLTVGEYKSFVIRMLGYGGLDLPTSPHRFTDRPPDE